MKPRCIAFALAVFGLLTVPTRAQETLSARSALLLDSLSTRKVNTTQHDGPHRAGRTGFWTTEGRLVRGKADSTTWSYLSASITDADGLADAGGANGGFSGWPGMDCWMRFNPQFPQAQRDQFIAKFTTMPTYHSGSTPNQKMMWAVACRLACEQWGTDVATSVSNADYLNNGDKTGRDYIISKAKYAVKYNFEERWAKHYLTYTMGPLRTVSDFTTDAELAQVARMANNWGFADIAPTNFYGHWAIPAGRGTSQADGNTFEISEFNTWLLMGGPSPASLLDADQSCYYIMPGAQDPTILPELVEAGTDRSQPYTSRHLARLFETQFATTYMTKDYSLFSQVDGDTTLNPDGTVKLKDLDNNGVPSNDWNSERWALIWNDAPDYAGSMICMKPPTSYGWAVGSGIAPYEDVVQHEGVLAGIINIPATGNQYTKDTIPTNTLAVIDDTATTGRLFLHYKTVLVAILRSDIGTFTWPAPAQTPCVKRGFAIETASPSEYPQPAAADRLAAFRADVLAHAADMSQVSGATPRMIYTTRDGTVLDITYGLGGKINGDPVDYESWPMSESPWTSQQQQGNMFVFGKDRTLLWNYKNWTELENRRPTVTAASPVTASGASSVDVDLSTRVTDAETPAANLKYRITGATNGAAAILADGKTARFTPAADIAGAGTFTFTAGDAFPDSRLIFHYDFEQADPVASNVVKDVSSQDRHGTATVAGLASLAGDAAAPAALGSQSMKSLMLTSSNFGGGKISRQVNPANVNLSNGEWTFATWVNRASCADDDFLFYVGSGDGYGGNGDELQLYMPAQAKRIALLHISGNGSVDVNLSTAATVDANEWHHVAVQFERTSFNTGNVRLYLDGALAGTTTGVTWALNQTDPVFIGGPALNSVFSRCFAGRLDDVALFRGKLSAAEIAELATGSVAQLGGLKVSQTVQVQSAPLPPSGLTATAANNVITLTWPAANGATGYTVKRGSAIGGPFTNIASGLTGTSYTDATAAFGTTYFYVVSATSAAGESANSNAASATLPAADLAIWSGGTMNGWSKGARIGFAGYTRNETLTNFPVLVAIDATNVPGFSYAQLAFSNGADLRFTDSTGTTELNYEIDTWNPAGTSYAWVQVPALTANTSICAFWGNPAANATAQPDSIANLSMWLKADAITGLADGATVNAWPDSSANGRNATLLSGTPVLKTNVLNGKPVVRFTSDGNSGFSFPKMTDIRTVFWVVKETATTGIHFLLGDDATYDFHRGTGGPIWSPTNASINIRNGTTRLMGSSVNGTTTPLGTGYRIVSVVTAGNVQASRLSKDRSIVARSCDGDVVEVIVYNRALTGSEEARVGNYLAQKYALTVTYPAVPPAYTTNGATWSNGYLGVFHLRETSGQHISSAIGAAATRAVSATNQGNATGMIGVADNFDGTSGYVSLPDLGSSPQVTVEAWVNLASAPANTYGGGVVGSDLWTSGCAFFEVLPNRTLTARINSAGSVSTASGSIPLGTWTHVAYTVESSGADGLKLYQSGGLVGSSTGHAGNNLTDLNIAREYTNRWLPAKVDEVRISSVARSAAWLWATNANIVSPATFLRAAPVATYAAAAAPQVTTLPANAITGTSATLNGNLAYTGTSPTSVTIYWGPVNGGNTPTNWANSESLGVRPAGAFSANTGNLTSGSTYYFRAFATNANGSTWASDVLSFTTNTNAPASLTASPAGGLVSLSWTASPGAQSYNVKRSTVSGGPYTTLLDGVLGTTFSDTTAATGATYYYVVSAVGAGGESGNSPQAVVQTVAPPTGLGAVPGNAGVALSWTASSGATSYTVKRSTTGGGPYSAVQSGITGTSFTDTAAVNGTPYFYVVTAAAIGFESAISNEVSAKPLASIAAPTGLVGTPSTTSIALSWNAVADAQSYVVKRATVNGGPYTQIAAGLLAPNYNNTGLTTGTAYYYVVTAVNGSIESVNSSQLAVTPATTPTTFTTPGGGSWSTAVWSPQQPVSAFATTIVLTNPAAVTSAQNLGTLLLNNLQLTNQAVALSGDGLYFAGTSPAISTTQNVAHTIANAIGLDTQTRFSISANTTTINATVYGVGGITKSGNGTLVFAAANTFAGGTTLDGGTLRFVADDADVNAITLGATAGSANVTALDLASASIGADSLAVQTNSTSNNTISIGANRTLRVNGDFSMGTYASSTASTCKLVATGSGAITVAGASGSFRIGTHSGGSGVNNTLDLSGVGSFTLDYGSDGQLVIGNGSTGSGSVNTLTLSPNTSITVGSIRLGDYQVASSMQLLKLGSGTNTIFADSISIGTTASPSGGGRGAGAFQFNGAGGSVIIRDQGGVGGADLSIADNGGAGNGYGTFNVTGHNADIKIHALRMGASTSSTARTDTFSFNQGTLEIRNVNIGLAQSSASYARTSQINIGGGNATLGLGDVDDPGFISLATNGTGVLNLTGGNVAACVDITESAGTGSATLILNGATLDLTGHAIVGLTTLNLQSGTLKNVAQINGGAAIAKTGTGTLMLAGNNTFTSPVAISGGTLNIVSTHVMSGAISGTGNLVVSGTLAGSGQVSAPTTVNGSLAPQGGSLGFNGSLTFGATGRLVSTLSGNSTGGGQVTAAGNLATAAPVDVVLNASGSSVDLTTTFWSSPQSWPLIAAASLGAPFTLGNISNDPGGRVPAAYGRFTLQQTGTTLTLIWTPLTAIESWRYAHFGRSANTGTAADAFDADADGECNLLEFATGQDPHAGTGVQTPIQTTASGIDFTYTRNRSATGLTFLVEWSDTLATGSWSTAGVTQTDISPDPNSALQTIRASLPAGTGSTRFIRLKVVNP